MAEITIIFLFFHFYLSLGYYDEHSGISFNALCKSVTYQGWWIKRCLPIPKCSFQVRSKWHTNKYLLDCGKVTKMKWKDNRYCNSKKSHAAYQFSTG